MFTVVKTFLKIPVFFKLLIHMECTVFLECHTAKFSVLSLRRQKYCNKCTIPLKKIQKFDQSTMTSYLDMDAVSVAVIVVIRRSTETHAYLYPPPHPPFSPYPPFTSPWVVFPALHFSAQHQSGAHYAFVRFNKTFFKHAYHY